MPTFRTNSPEMITPEEINIALGDMYSTPLPQVSMSDVYSVLLIVIVGLIVVFTIVFILDHLLAKYNSVTTYTQENMAPSKEVQRISNHKHKAKESPFIDYTVSIPPTQPTFYKLDKAEKGQNISLTLPYRRNIESDTKGHETKITILVQESKADMPTA